MYLICKLCKFFFILNILIYLISSYIIFNHIYPIYCTLIICIPCFGKPLFQQFCKSHLMEIVDICGYNGFRFLKDEMIMRGWKLDKGFGGLPKWILRTHAHWDL